MKQQQLTVSGQRIAYLESPGTGPVVLFVHGNSSSSGVWEPLLGGEFGARFRCLAIDLPGHGRSGPAVRSEDGYSLPGYAAVLAGFARLTGAEGAVLVGWSLGGHVVLEAAAEPAGAAGFVVFGAPPVSGAADFGRAFLPGPALNIGFTGEVDAEGAEAYARSFLAPGSALPVDDLVADILATDGAARTGLFASLGAGRFTDEIGIVGRLDRPLAVLHGEGDQLVSLEYLRGLAMPTLWRGALQVIPGGGHAPHIETPGVFAELVGRFVREVGEGK
ncbi:alpha/beta hydrolase [Streptomyces sp. NPDC093252]|uniref:alpha/beta fold hydrolase n=1 Tax=Streptomyces sp. NPDC093252 TaxID=3154980 RepID=UPI003448C058